MKAAYDMTFEQRLARIDLAKPLARLARESGMSAETLARAEDLYRKWLTLKAKNPDVFLVPSVLIDKLWEAHFAYSKQYIADCELLFGEIMHHNPVDEDTTEAFESGTVALFEKEYGISLYAYGIPAELMGASGCGS